MNKSLELKVFFGNLIIVLATIFPGLANPAPARILLAETSLADVIDKITILRIKQEHIKNIEKLNHINNELTLLSASCHEALPPSKEIASLSEALLEINKTLWDLEDAVRLKEQTQCFDKEFSILVDLILTNNDTRACIKRAINLLGGSHIVEEKSYAHVKESSQTPKKLPAQIAQQISIMAPLSLGELVDRITILLIKYNQIDDPKQHAHILSEYQSLNETLNTYIIHSADFEMLFKDLLEINKTMWDIQEKIRIKKNSHELDAIFIELGRSVYQTNDKRSAIKYKINKLSGSQLVEEKEYVPYSTIISNQ